MADSTTIKIVSINDRNEPFNLNFANTQEEIFFYYEVTAGSVLELNDDEIWEWNFDDQNTEPKDQVIQTIENFSNPIPIVFSRSGNRTVTLNVYDFDENNNKYLKYTDTTTFYIYNFPSEINGPDFVSLNSTIQFTLNSTLDAELYRWYVNGKLSSTTDSLTYNFDSLIRLNIRCNVVNGSRSVWLDKTCTVTTPKSVMGKKYEGDVTPNLMFFNKEGDNLNFDYYEDGDEKRWEGEMMFHVNSDDTFKTIGLYMLEKVEPLKYRDDNLFLKKFQYFNEFGTDFNPSTSTEVLIDDIQAVNNEDGFYSKWIIGNNIQQVFPIGTEVYIDDVNQIDVSVIDGDAILNAYNKIDDFRPESVSGGVRTFTVVSNRRDAIMVISETENSSYDIRYGYGEFRLSNNAIAKVPQGKVKSFNLIKFYDTDKLNSDWNETDLTLYDKKKISVVNSQYNDGLYTVNFVDDLDTNTLQDKVLKLECVDLDSLLPVPDNGFKIEFNFKTSRVFLSSQPVDFIPKSSLDGFLNQKELLIWEKFGDKDYTPNLLQEDVEFFFIDEGNSTNTSFTYKVLEVNTAENVIVHNSDDESGYKIVIKDNKLINNKTFKFKVNKSNYTLKEGVEFDKGVDESETAENLADAFSDIFGLSVIAVDNEVWIHVRAYIEFSYLTTKTTKHADFKEGLLNTNRPTYGIVGDEWVHLIDLKIDGYIHRRINQKNYQMLFFVDDVAYWYVLPFDKKVVWVETQTVDPVNEFITFEENIFSDAYLKDTKITYIQEGDEDATKSEILQRFLKNTEQSLTKYGIDMYLDNNMFCFSRAYPTKSLSDEDDYLDVRIYKNLGNDEYEEIPTTIEGRNIRMFPVIEDLKEEYNRSFGGKYNKERVKSKLFTRKIKIEDININSGFTLNINGVDYSVPFDNVATSLSYDEDQIIDIEETLMDWGNQRFSLEDDITPEDTDDVGRRYHQLLESQGILTWLEKSENSFVNGVQKFDTIVIQSKYPNITIDYNVIGTENGHKIYHSDIEFEEIGSILTITVNSVAYNTQYQGSISATINQWVEDYYYSLIAFDIIVEVIDDKIRISTLNERTTLRFQVWVGITPTITKELYKIISYREGNEGIIVSGNEVYLPSNDFQDIGFGTGMITNVLGSKYTANNQEYNIVFVDPNVIGLSYQGAFWGSNQNLSDIVDRSGFDWTTYDEFNEPIEPLIEALTLSSREFLRYPRERFDGEEPIRFRVRWEDSVDDTMFFYDFSGKQLEKKVTDQGIYQYSGVTPLVNEDDAVYLNRNPNRDIERVKEVKYQQTIFDELLFDLKLVDSEDSINPLPEPLEVFVGFKSDLEGVDEKTLLIERIDDEGITVTTKKENNQWRNIVHFNKKRSEISLENSTTNFITSGFKVGQKVRISGRDIMNSERQAVFKNAGYEGVITNVTVSKIKLKPLSKDMVDEKSLTTTKSIIPPFLSKEAAFEISIDIIPNVIGRIKLKGQTEVEDERFKIALGNFGYDINYRDIFIFKEYDIKENGIDWIYMNSKRKEMLSVYPEIYNYLSTYKSIINTINYFGYNDLELYEYYINDDPDSEQYKKLVKVEVPDIFNNRVEGWNDMKTIKTSFEKMKKTKLFNLTYKITDEEGNIILGYSLDEIITKILGLKKWLKENNIPIGTDIRDITGVGQTKTVNEIWHDVKFSRKFYIRENITPVDFKIESYLQPVENNSRTYNVNLSFFTNSDEYNVDYYHLRITTYAKNPKNNQNLKSVQLINEFKTDLKSYNFAVDRKMDNFIEVEVSCENGYGSNYSIRRTYSLENNRLV